jgi:hypothetical protein
VTGTALEVASTNEVDQSHGIPYERIIEWAAGPIAIVAGAIAVWLDNHFGLLGKAGLGKDQTAKAIVDCLTFGVGAILTYLGHSQWLGNLTKWWQNAQTVTATTAVIDQGGSIVTQEEEQTTPDTEEDTPAEQAPFEDEPGYDDPGEGVEPDQELDSD